MNAKIPSKYIEVSAGKMHYKETGDTAHDTLLFLHGFPEFWYSWRKQIDYFSTKYHVVVPDLRGYNQSLKPKQVKDYKVQSIANDVLELIQTIGKDKVVIIGHDWGAAIAWHLLLLHKDRFAKGIILNVPHPLVFRKNFFTNLRQIVRSWYILFFQIPFLPAWLLSRNNFKNAAKALTDTSLEGSFSEDDLEQYKQAWGNEHAIRYMIMWYKATLRYPLQANAYKDKKVNVPLKIIWGKKDKALVATMAKESLHYCEQGDLTYIDEATHWVHQDRPDKVNQLIEAFLIK